MIYLYAPVTNFFFNGGKDRKFHTKKYYCGFLFYKTLKFLVTQKVVFISDIIILYSQWKSTILLIMYIYCVYPAMSKV